MNPSYDYAKFCILYVDDESQTAANLQEYLSDVFQVKVATSGEEGWRIFNESPDSFAIVMTDQRMPESSGVDLLEKVRGLRPRVLRILATAYSDLDAAIQAVNSGAIYKYITKPWDPPTLEMTLKRGMEFFLVQRERDLLLNEKIFAMQRMMMTDRLISLGIFAAGLNHHLRNSLTAIKTFIDLAPSKLKSEMLDIEHLKNPDYWHDFYGTVQGQVSKVVSILRELQQIPEPPPLPLSDTVMINDLLKAAIDSRRGALDEKQLKVTLNEGAVSPIQGNAAMLERAVRLLLEDEIINVAVGGNIVISTENHTDATGTTGARIVVSDNGPDLPVEALTCIFDPFFVRRNQPEEYGLNLLTVFFLIYHHGGQIVIKSSSAGGALFEVFIPYASDKLPGRHDEQEFLRRVFATEKVWEKILLEA